MSLTTDFNIPPYFDDYNEAKKFYRILFRPSVAVQARELTQLQTIQQKQIERFGNHIFKDGSVVEGCNPTTLANLSYVRVADSFTANANALITSVTSDFLLVGQTSNVRAVALITKPGDLVSYPNTNRFYVKYITTGANNVTTFANAEVISIYSYAQNKLGTLDANNLVNTINVISTNSTVNAVGTGYGFRVESGIIYQKGFFQLVEDQYTIVRDYDQNVENYVVGFQTQEAIITENEDTSLNDNALGYSNENAPGAHRLQLTPTIVAKDRTTIANNDTFFTLFEFSNISKDLVINRQKTPYDNLSDIMNQRTYDESGDYVTKPFQVESIQGANTTSFAYQVSAGKGYIHGSQVEYLSSRKIDTDKAVTTLEAPEQIITANYGNYVYVKEVGGVINFSGFADVDIYDTPQQAITNNTLASGSVTGTRIGSAKVKAFVHDTGDPGQANTTYRLFLTNITMFSGNSFITNAKSIYRSDGTYGKFFCDIQLTSSQAILQQSGKSTLIFPFGKKALKTLRSNAGTTNRTQFYFRETVQATLQSNGYISALALPAYSGGFEQIGYSNGIVGDTLERDFVVSMQANVSTANISGNTVSVSSGCNQITGVNLNLVFANGEFIKINETTSATSYYRIVSANTSKAVISPTPSFSNTASSFAKHYPAGYYIPLGATYPGTRNVNILSNTSFEINTGLASSASLTTTSNVWIQFTALRTQATQAKKEINRDRFVKLYANAATNGAWNLGLSDVLKISSVISNSSSFSNTGVDVTNYFYLDNGQRDEVYDHSKLVLNPRYSNILTNEYLTVKLDHFSANLNNGIGFFSVDSYPIDDANTANTNAIQTAQIPYYISSNGSFIDLRDSADFRPYKANTANSSTDLANATLNPATTNNLISYYSTSYLCAPDTNFQADIEYYLGRIDLITMNSTGGLGVIKGNPSEKPVRPINDSDTMVLCYGIVPPYPSLSVREAESYNRKDYSVRTQLATNRGYTMKDIGAIEARINRLEYYTTLNLLEQKANSLQTADANGLNRFKNGIFADPMNSHALAQPNDIEYRYSIDFDLGYGRPLFDSKNVDLTYDSGNSSGVAVTGKLVTLPYTNEKYIDQPFATKYRNTTQEIWSWKGTVDLYPSYDMNRDETRLPNVDASIDLTTPFLDFANVVAQSTNSTIFGTRWGDWRTTSSSTTQTNVITTVEQQVRSGTNNFVSSTKQTFDLGKYVTDITVQPYMKSKTIAFIARNLKPNTKIYAYFDDTPVSQYCAPGTLNTSLGATLKDIVEAANKVGRVDSVLNRTSPFGTQLVSDSNGTLYGLFVIPEGKFRVGDRQLQLIDSDSLITGADAALTRASAVYTASSISLSTRNATITAVEPVFNQSSLTDSRTVTTVRPIPREDPLAQSFFIEPPQEQSGVFITKLDVFFKAKDPTLGVKLAIVGMNNGYPDATTTYGSSRLASGSVNVSDDASLATTFTLDQPIFLAANKEYAFYIEPEGGSPEYKLWMAETGGTDVLTGAQVFGNPYTGDAFRSSNARTWTTLPKEDVKFNLYVANFTIGTGIATFTNENDEYFVYNGLTFPNSDTNLRSLKVGDQVYMINSTSNTVISNTSISGYIQGYDTTKSTMDIDSSTGNFIPGHAIGVFRLNQQGNTSQANSTTLIATATINTISNPVLHSIVPRFATMLPMNTTLDIDFKGKSNTGILDTNWNTLSMDQEREMLDYERIVYSKTNEGAQKSLLVRATMSSYNKYISPVIDFSRKSALVLQNLINNDNTNEANTRYGSAISKYINKPVVLADGQDAEDIKVIVGAYRPINTDVEVYVKFLNADDIVNINDKVWTKLDNASPSLRSSPIDIYDWREYEYNIPSSVPSDGSNPYAGFKNASNYGILEYKDSTGAIYRSYKTFMIKIVLLSSDNTYVPKINDVRAIALQV